MLPQKTTVRKMINNSDIYLLAIPEILNIITGNIINLSNADFKMLYDNINAAEIHCVTESNSDVTVRLFTAEQNPAYDDSAKKPHGMDMKRRISSWHLEKN